MSLLVEGIGIVQPSSQLDLRFEATDSEASLHTYSTNDEPANQELSRDFAYNYNFDISRSSNSLNLQENSVSRNAAHDYYGSIDLHFAPFDRSSAGPDVGLEVAARFGGGGVLIDPVVQHALQVKRAVLEAEVQLEDKSPGHYSRHIHTGNNANHHGTHLPDSRVSFEMTPRSTSFNGDGLAVRTGPTVTASPQRPLRSIGHSSRDAAWRVHQQNFEVSVRGKITSLAPTS
jgi:hypothetical protein